MIATIKALDERGIGCRSLHERLDTATPGGKLIFHIFGALAEFEPGARRRALIRKRTQAGLAAARARGRQGGRPAVLDARRRQRAVALYREGKLTPVEIARTVGCSHSTLYRALRAVAPVVTQQ